MKDLNPICHDFYNGFLQHKDISEEVMREVFEDFLSTFTRAMNALFTRDIP